MRATHCALLIGSLAGATAVALGAFGAHALRASLDERALAIWRTAVDYQFWHALALLLVGVLARESRARSLRVAGAAFAIGLPLFCASLYALALGAPGVVGAITPMGGVAFIAGWLALAWYAWRIAGRAG